MKPAFPLADRNKLASVFANWGRMIHAPIKHGQSRRRVYPQNLVFDLLEAFRLAQSSFDSTIIQDLGVFSRIIQDVETVFPSVDTKERFTSILNFLSVVAPILKNLFSLDKQPFFLFHSLVCYIKSIVHFFDKWCFFSKFYR